MAWRRRRGADPNDDARRAAAARDMVPGHRPSRRAHRGLALGTHLRALGRHAAPRQLHDIDLVGRIGNLSGEIGSIGPDCPL
jgi:hypothetical protein